MRFTVICATRHTRTQIPIYLDGNIFLSRACTSTRCSHTRPTREKGRDGLPSILATALDAPRSVKRCHIEATVRRGRHNIVRIPAQTYTRHTLRFSVVPIELLYLSNPPTQAALRTVAKLGFNDDPVCG